MKTMEIYKNYGCLAAEKKVIYTYGNEAGTAVCSDQITVIIPDGWETSENIFGDLLLIAPWGDVYLPNDILGGNEQPHFIVMDDKGNERHYKLQTV